jgi:hypothetical protein
MDDDWPTPEHAEAVVRADNRRLVERVRQLEADVDYWRTQAESYEQSVLEMTAAMELYPEKTTPLFPEIEPLRPSMPKRPQAMSESREDYELREQM